jgi:uncharacterized protein DUF1153
MYVKKTKGPNFVTLPNGRKLTRSDLPPSNTKRWVASRKASVVLAVQAGLVNSAEVCDMYDLSNEELESWVGAVKSHGIKALKITKLQNYRQP